MIGGLLCLASVILELRAMTGTRSAQVKGWEEDKNLEQKQTYFASLCSPRPCSSAWQSKCSDVATGHKAWHRHLCQSSER